MRRYTVFFQPDNVIVEVDAGVDVLTAARQANVEIKSSCGGDGTCGKCLVKIISGQVIYRSAMSAREGYVLACKTLVQGDVVVEVPEFSRLVSHRVLLDKCDILTDAPDIPVQYPFDPLVKKVSLQLIPPTLIDPGADLERLKLAFTKATGLEHVEISVSLALIQQLGKRLRDSNWNIDVTYYTFRGITQILEIETHRNHAALWGLAIDIGTTTVVAYLVDMLSGSIIGKAGTHNKQAKFGDDVISRIIHSVEQQNGLAVLQDSIINTVNGLVKELVQKHNIVHTDIRGIVCAGNTTMAHLLLGIDPQFIRLEPYVPTAHKFPFATAKDLKIAVHPEAVVYNFPAIASYVGGDIVAGTLTNGMAEEEPLTLFIDIGTNGEMVLGNNEWLMCCSCSAGPSFEGAGITYGMRAMQGAIERINIDPQTYEVTYSTIGGTGPIGICGSGLIDTLAKMRKTGVIDRAGKFQPIQSARMRKSDAGVEFVLAWSKETSIGQDVVITEADVKNLLRAKAAVYAGIRSLLKTVDIDMLCIARIYIAGGFGSYLNIADAIEIGLLPDLLSAKYQFVGNTSVRGAYAALISAGALKHGEELAERMTYIELSVGNMFMEEFISAMFLPHTDLTQFPSVNS